MGRVFTISAQYLAPLILTIGLSVYGCSDSATVNPVVELASLTITPGTLQPGFKGSTTEYNVNLTTDITSVTVQAQAAVSGDTVTINGQRTASSTITLGDPGTPTPVSIVVSESGTNSRTYTILLKRAGLTENNSLKNLTVSPGTLAPPFDANELFYTVDVDNTVGSVTVTPTLDDPAATMTVNGQPATSDQPQPITLDTAGKNTLIEIVVKAQNGNLKQYHVSVSRGVSANNKLKNLTISLGAGTSNLISKFSPGTLGYSVNVPSTATSVTVTPTRDDATASMSLSVNGGQPTNISDGQSLPITLGQPGSNTFINIIVTAQNGNQNTYSVVVNRPLSSDSNLEALTVTVGTPPESQTLSPTFDSSQQTYTVNVAGKVDAVTVSATKSDPNAAMAIGSVPVPAGTATGKADVQLGGPGSETSVSITVTPQTGNPKTYSLTIRQLSNNNNLSALNVTAGGAAQPLDFKADTTSYTVSVASEVSSVDVTATKADPNAVLSGSVANPGAGQATGQAPITLNGAGTDTPVRITVTAPDGESKKTYDITVKRAASNNNNLSALSVTAQGKAQPLDVTANASPYTVNVASTVTSVLVTATKADPNAVLSGSVADPGAGVATGQATIPLGGPLTTTPVAITVTAPDGTPKTYTIGVYRTFLLFQ
jgi:hypothetical protein